MKTQGKRKIGLIVNDDKTWQFIDQTAEGGENLTDPIPWEVFMRKMSLADIRLITMGKSIDYKKALALFTVKRLSVKDPKDREEIENRTGETQDGYIDRAEAFLIDGITGAWIVELKDGGYWAMAYNEDELFKTQEEAFKWLKERL